MNNTYYFGRNIKQDENGYYLMYHNHKAVNPKRNDFKTSLRLESYDEALKYLTDLLNVGHTYCDPHIDPTI